MKTNNVNRLPESPQLTGDNAPACGEVHIWKVSLEAAALEVIALGEWLAPVERAQAAHFHFLHDQRRFIVRRAALRQLLASTLGITPETVRFVAGPNGKPAIANPTETAPLKFNCSHSADLALIAVSRGIELGVDLEQHRDLPDADDLAKAYYSESEIRELSALPPAQRTPGFFNCWTRKEAFVKAIGLGLSFPLDQFSVSLSPNRAEVILNVPDSFGALGRWFMVSLDVASDYSAALAFMGNVSQIKFFQWNPQLGA